VEACSCLGARRFVRDLEPPYVDIGSTRPVRWKVIENAVPLRRGLEDALEVLSHEGWWTDV
jgi:hypothetical protein